MSIPATLLIAAVALLLGVALGYLLARSRAATTDAMRQEFKQLATEVVRESRDEIGHIAADKVGAHAAEASKQLEARRDEVDQLIAPIRQHLERLAEHTQQLEKERAAAYRALDEKVGVLDAHTRSLANALSGSSQARGAWGEVTLRRILELAGLERHVVFYEQTSVDTSRRPDVLVQLPQDRVLPIDAKAPGAAWLRAAELPEGPERDAALQDHAKALREQVKQLARKDYANAVEGTFDHVVLFLPNEAMAGAAFDANPDVFAEAMQRRVLIATPVTLLALLRTVELYWRQHEVDENAKAIEAAAQTLVDRVGVLAQHFARIDKGLNDARTAYDAAVGAYQTRFLPQARRLEKLGLPPKKALPDFSATGDDD